MVAVCTGPRCRALRTLHDPSADAAGPGGAALHHAVRQRPDAVLISTDCLGACDRGCVAAIGTGTAGDDGRITWREQPVGLGLVELPDRAADLAAWVRHGAPAVTALPHQLRQARTG